MRTFTVISGNIHLQLEWLTSGIVAVDVDFVYTFKYRLEKFWLDQPVMFD